MSYLIRMSQDTVIAYRKNWGWFFAWGILLIALGALAIIYSAHTTVISVIILGVMLAGGGLVVIFDTFQFWWGKWGGFFVHLLTGILYLAVGIMFIKGPVIASLSLTFILAIFYIALGSFRLIYSLSMELTQRGWRIFNGIVTLALGILILLAWPKSGLIIIGLFIGIDLLLVGFVYVMAALAAKSLTSDVKS